MINWLHTFNPQAILLSFGHLHIYWYGLFMVLGIITALGVSLKLARYYKVANETIFDLSFWLIISSLLGARLYDVFLNFSYYLNSPLEILKIWRGGLAIHGAIIAGLITVYFFSKKQKISFWKLTAIITPGLALGQAIGRWGNYFNQELFGLPTTKPWGIPISLLNRPADYVTSRFFQPTFLYESLGCLLIFIVLIGINRLLIKKNLLNRRHFILLTSFYMILYSILRFFLEFIKIDATPTLFGLRWPQIVSLLIVSVSVILLILNRHDNKKEKNA